VVLEQPHSILGCYRGVYRLLILERNEEILYNLTMSH